MDSRSRHFLDAKVVFSLFLIAAGALMILDNFYYIDFSVWDWWPLILIFIGLGQFAQPKESRQTFTGGILIIVGLLFLGRNLDWYYFRFHDIWPLILIFVGIMILRNHIWKKGSRHTDEGYLNLFFFMGGGDHSYSSHKLQGGSLTAVMGGGKLDFREASMVENSMEIEVFVMWGGIEMIVPKNWKVSFQGMPLLGGVENKTSAAIVKENGAISSQAEKELIIKGLVLMGGLEIKN